MRQQDIDWLALHHAFSVNTPGVKCFLSLSDGTVTKLAAGDPRFKDYLSDPNQRAITVVPPRVQYQWLDTFIRTVADEPLREQLLAAINGKGAFRRFKDLLLSRADERRHWFELREQLQREYIVQWVAEQGIEPINQPPWLEENGDSMRPPVPPSDLAALRAFLQSWSQKVQAEPEPLSSANLDTLAQQLCERFRLSPL